MNRILLWFLFMLVFLFGIIGISTTPMGKKRPRVMRGVGWLICGVGICTIALMQIGGVYKSGSPWFSILAQGIISILFFLAGCYGFFRGISLLRDKLSDQ